MRRSNDPEPSGSKVNDRCKMTSSDHQRIQTAGPSHLPELKYLADP
jgi:hypothetical protein